MWIWGSLLSHVQPTTPEAVKLQWQYLRLFGILSLQFDSFWDGKVVTVTTSSASSDCKVVTINKSAFHWPLKPAVIIKPTLLYGCCGHLKANISTAIYVSIDDNLVSSKSGNEYLIISNNISTLYFCPPHIHTVECMKKFSFIINESSFLSAYYKHLAYILHNSCMY